ncbi:hypothetical protein AAZX31_06G007000 [Glycine max]
MKSFGTFALSTWILKVPKAKLGAVKERFGREIHVFSNATLSNVVIKIVSCGKRIGEGSSRHVKLLKQITE